MTNLQSNNSISSVESNAVPIINKNKVSTDIPSTKKQPVSQIINVQPIYANVESLEEQIIENNQNDLHSTNIGDNVESNNPTTIIENSVVLDPSLFLSSNHHVATINEKKKIFKVLQRQKNVI